MAFLTGFLPLKKKLVSPQKSGKLTIPAFEVSTVVNRDFFNQRNF